MHPHAETALRAAKLHFMSGRYAARRYAERRGCPDRLLRLAIRLEQIAIHERDCTAFNKRVDDFKARVLQAKLYLFTSQ